MGSDFGWQIDVVTFGDAGPAPDWEWGEVHLAAASGRRERALRRLRRLLSEEESHFDTHFPYGELDRVIGAGRYDVVHWKDLAAAVMGARVARAHGARFVLDLHENYPYNMWSTERDSGVRDDRLHNLNAWFRYEQTAIESADITLVTIEEMAQRLTGMHHVDPSRLRVVHNTDRLSRWSGIPDSEELRSRFSGRLLMVYAGSCSVHRGVDTILRALPEVRRSLPEIVLAVVGEGPAIPAWRRLADELGVGDVVAFDGAMPLGRMQAYYPVTAFGVIPHHKYGQTDNTAPHKLYHNMLTRLPTLVSSCHTLQRIIADTDAGIVFEAGRPDSAAAAILQLADPDLRRRLGENGYAAVTAPPYSWEHSVAVLEEAYTSSR